MPDEIDLKRVAFRICSDMREHDGLVGVELDSPAYKDLLRETCEKEACYTKLSRVDWFVRQQLADLGKPDGFS